MIGFIYIMSNPAYPGDLKIGQTRNDPEERRKDLGSTGVLQDFVLEYRALSEDYLSLEREIHKSLAQYRVRANKEFFSISVPEAINKIREIAGDRIESDKVFYVSPEDLLRAEEEKKKLIEENKARIEEIKKKRERIAEKERKQKLKESLQKLEAIAAKKKAEESEKLRIEKEKEKEQEKENLEYRKNLFHPPKNIFKFPFWFVLIPLEWAILKKEDGAKWLEAPYIFLGITLMVTNFAILALLIGFLLDLLGIEY
jgi:hypothetical protein